MDEQVSDGVDERFPTLLGPRLRLRPGTIDDVEPLHRILGEASVRTWWGEAESREQIALDLAGDEGTCLLVVEVEGSVVGGVQYAEEDDPMYRHAGLDVFLGTGAQGRGLGQEVVGRLCRFLVDERGHHRLTIDPSATNTRAIRCYEAVGFRPVGLMRRYEQAPDGTWRDSLLMDLLAEELRSGP